MSDQPDLSTLPQRMRYAAIVVEEARKERHRRIGDGQVHWPVSDFVAQDLRKIAGEWEAEDRAADERESEVEALARELFAYGHPSASWAANPRTADICRDRARELIESGWRKGDPE